MGASVPPDLARLLAASDAIARESAWDRFVSSYSRLLLHVARSVSREHDAAMDAYAYVLEAFRRDDHRRLRAYAPDGRTKFTTWLVVVTRRLCLDAARQKYGRAPGANVEERETSATRRRLADLVAEQLDPDQLATTSDQTAEARETAEALTAVLDMLEPRDRVLLRLRFEQDLGAREIAATMGFPTPFHVYRRLNVLLERLRHALRARGIEGPP